MRRAEHRAAAKATRRDTDAADEWAKSQGVALPSIDGDDMSPDVHGNALPDAAVQPWDVGTDVRFSPNPLRLDDDTERLEARAANGDDNGLALLDKRYRQERRHDRAERLAAITGNSTRQTQRRVREAGRRLVDCVQIATHIVATPETVFEVLNGLPDEVQSEVARLAQREADYREIEKAISSHARKRRLSEGVLRVLDAIGRNRSATRDRLSRLSVDDQKAALVDLVQEWRDEANRTRAREWRKEWAFERALSVQATDNATETVKRFNALPFDQKYHVAAEITRDLDEEILA